MEEKERVSSLDAFLPSNDKGNKMADEQTSVETELTSGDVKRSINVIRSFVTRFVDPFRDVEKHLSIAYDMALKLEATSNKLSSVEIRHNETVQTLDIVK